MTFEFAYTNTHASTRTASHMHTHAHRSCGVHEHKRTLTPANYKMSHPLNFITTAEHRNVLKECGYLVEDITNY